MLGDYGESDASLNQRDSPIVLVCFVGYIQTNSFIFQ